MKKRDGFFIGAVIGGTAAAVAALLLAPKSGKDLRKDLSVKKEELTTDFLRCCTCEDSKVTETTKEKIQLLSQHATNLTNGLTAKTKHSLDKAQDASVTVLENMKKQTSELNERFKQAVEDISEKVEETSEEDIFINMKEAAKQAKETVTEG